MKLPGLWVTIALALLISLSSSACGSESEGKGDPSRTDDNALVSVPTSQARTPRRGSTPSPSASGGPPTSTPAGSATATPLPAASTNFRFGKLVDPGDRAIIEAGVEIAASYLEELADVKQPQVNGYVYVDLSDVAVQWEGILQASGTSPEALLESFGFYAAQAMPGTIFINTSSEPWERLSAVHQLRLAAHEYFHTMQLELVGPANARSFYSGGTDAVGVLGPHWLVEGSAEFISWRALESAGLLDLEQHMANRQASTFNPKSFSAYQDFYTRGQPAYDISLDTVYRLVSKTDSLSLIAYFWLIGQGFEWREAFNKAFGQTVDNFYTE